MKVANIEALRDETMKALNEEFGLVLIPCILEYDHINNGKEYRLKHECALTNDLFHATFDIVFTDDYLFFRQDGTSHTFIDYHELKNKAQYFMRMAVTVNNIIESGK